MASRPSRSRPATERWCWRPEAGPTPSSTRPRPVPVHQFSCTTARKPARSASWSSRADRRSGPLRFRRLRRCPPTACRRSSTSGTPCASSCRSAVSRLTGSSRSTSQPPPRPPSAPRPAAPWCWRSPIAPISPACSISTAIISGCWTAWTTAGSRSGWIRSRSNPGQTQRIAFLAEYPGRFLIESVATDWAAPRLVRWYSVELRKPTRAKQ